MGEFVGIDPSGAGMLIKHLERAKAALGRTRPPLESAITEAGADWAGGAGTAAMHRTWAFFDDSQRDLKWRIATITRMEDTRLDGRFLTGTLPFASRAEAAEKGRSAGAVLLAILAVHLAEGSPESWRRVEAAMTAAGQGAIDPAYAQALLTALGPKTYSLLFSQWMDVNVNGPRRGLSPEELERARASLGPLAELYATADTDGRLGGDWDDELLKHPAMLSAMLALGKQSPKFHDRAGRELLRLGTAGHQPSSPHLDWNSYWLVKAFDADPDALRRLLAGDKEAASLLLRPGLVKLNGMPGFEDVLASALDKALGRGDEGERTRALFNVVNALGAEGADEVGGHFDSLKNSPINEVLARKVVPYLGELGLGHAKETAEGALPGQFAPAPPWNGLKVDVGSRFIGAVMQDPAAVKILQAESQKYVQGLDIGKFHPFGDEAERHEYTVRSAKAGGLASLLLSGSTHVEWNDDQTNEFIAEVLTMPVGYAINKWWNIRAPVVATGRDQGVDQAKGDISDLLQDYMDGKTPLTAKEVADALIDKQHAWTLRALEQHDQMALSASDKFRLRLETSGHLHAALLKILEKRGG
ncbi:hypothetical protein ACIBQX_41235 [Nonomuraea sp. NPDC049714]|uniref:hypothetical protein n=1 Tax=Nonomuraea sp. NPDC049714 TaxID=3364357 RepID=UPI0037946A89